MRPHPLSVQRLLPPAIAAVVVLVFIEGLGTTDREHPDAAVMKGAAVRSRRYAELLEGEMNRRGTENFFPDVPHGELLGPEYSPLTTTLGSLEAKRLSLDPFFASLLVRMIRESGADTGRPVGVALSGSFPGLGISVLAALDELGQRGVLVSSLGASMYGANREDLTWADMEHILGDQADVPFRSVFVTRGGEEDAGVGMAMEGIDAIEKSVRRTGRSLVVPSSLQEAIAIRHDVFRRESIGLLINIGGNQAMLGGCAHASSLPTGLWSDQVTCEHEDRGVMVRVNEEGIPVIHLLNLRGLSERYGLQAVPPRVYAVRTRSIPLVLAGLAVVFLTIVIAVRSPRAASRLLRQD